MLVQKSAKFNIDLNAKDNYGNTAFHFACYNKHESIVEMMMKNAKDFSLIFRPKAFMLRP